MIRISTVQLSVIPGNIAPTLNRWKEKYKTPESKTLTS